MRFKGINMRLAPAFTYRMSNGQDFYMDGKPMQPHYCVPVLLKDCVKAGAFHEGLRQEAKCPLKVSYHSRTDLICVLPKHVKSDTYREVEETITNQYIEHRYYAVKDGQVYTGTTLKVVTPEGLEYIVKKSTKA